MESGGGGGGRLAASVAFLSKANAAGLPGTGGLAVVIAGADVLPGTGGKLRLDGTGGRLEGRIDSVCFSTSPSGCQSFMPVPWARVSGEKSPRCKPS